MFLKLSHKFWETRLVFPFESFQRYSSFTNLSKRNHKCWWKPVSFNSYLPPQATLFVEQIFTKFDTDKNGTIDFRVSIFYVFLKTVSIIWLSGVYVGDQPKWSWGHRGKTEDGFSTLWQGLIRWSRCYDKVSSGDQNVMTRTHHVIKINKMVKMITMNKMMNINKFTMSHGLYILGPQKAWFFWFLGCSSS